MFPLFSFVALFLVSLQFAHSCSPSPSPATQCPPFASIVPFPFSAVPGCGHPSFRVKCASPHSLISINNISFALLHFDPNSTSLTLSPESSAISDNCSSSSSVQIPHRSIDFAGSPFRISDASCSRLSILRPCSPPILPNCSRCPWQCRLVKRPLELFTGCAAATRHLAEQGCQGDVLDYLGDMITRFGVQVEWDEAQDSYFSSCRDCRTNNGVCGFNASDPNSAFLCFRSKSRISPPWIRVDKTPDRIAILSSIFTLTCVFVAISIAITVFRSRRFGSGSGSIKEDPTALFLHRHRNTSPLPPVFTYEELEASTNRFDPKRKIGNGGFGSVYVAQLYDGRIVAVKHLHKHQTATVGNSFLTKSFCNEILILSSINHPNLVKLHGYCSDTRGLLLVHDYVPNGTLADHLHGGNSLCIREPMTWPMRLDIALQIALAMEYLHFSVIPPIVHRDITSSNIFVERDMRIKVGDFGLSRLLVVPETTSVKSEFVWTGPQGTPGYLDPEYHRSFRLTEKSDVYSFGVVLLELVSGLKAVDQRRERREVALADLVVAKIQMGLLGQVVDPVVAAEEGAMEGVKATAELAFRCVAADKDDRPDAREVVEELRRIRNRVAGDDGQQLDLR